MHFLLDTWELDNYLTRVQYENFLQSHPVQILLPIQTISSHLETVERTRSCVIRKGKGSFSILRAILSFFKNRLYLGEYLWIVQLEESGSSLPELPPEVGVKIGEAIERPRGDRNRTSNGTRRAGRLFPSGTTEIRVGRSNGGRGEPSRTWREGNGALGAPGATVTGTRKREMEITRSRRKKLVSCYRGH